MHCTEISTSFFELYYNAAGGAGGDGGKSGSGEDCRSPSGWKEEELLLKIDGEIKARNPNLEVLTAEHQAHSLVTQPLSLRA